MKKNLLIIVFLVISLMGAFTLKANAQHIQLQQRPNINYIPSVNPSDEKWNVDTISATKKRELIADETTISYNKAVAKIECCNESIAKVILQKWEQLITRYNCTRKKDRNGVYKQYNIYLNKDDAQYIIKWSKTNL